MNYCSHCGSDSLKIEVPPGDNRPRSICRNCDTIHYVNPKIVAGCLPIWDGKVLLCRRAIEPRIGYWNIPSGYLENGETVEEGAMREVYEEALAKVNITRMHALYSIPHINQVYIHFIGNLDKPDFGIGEESLEVALFDIENIPWKEIAFTSSVFSLKKYIEDRQKGFSTVHLGQFSFSQLE